MINLIKDMTTPDKITQKIQSLEHSLSFLQQEYALTLKKLHEEINTLQVKCKDLNTQLVHGKDWKPTSKINAEEEQQNAAIAHLEQELASLLSQLESRDKRVNMLEGQLKSKEKKFSGDLRNLQRKYASLQIEVENKTSTIAYLTSQMKLSKNTAEEPSPPQQEMPPMRRRSSRKIVVSPSANLQGFIQDQNNIVLQAQTKSAASERVQARLLSDSDSSDLGGARRLSRPRPVDYQEFLNAGKSLAAVAKSPFEPLPPITTRSGKKLSSDVLPGTTKRVLRSRSSKANAKGEITEHVIKNDALSTLPEKLHKNQARNPMLKQ